jgi:Mn-containing catalase
MFAHHQELMVDIRVDRPDPNFAKSLLEQFGGPNGELAAALRSFTQGWNEEDPRRRSMLLDIATEELSHLEVVAKTIGMLLKGSPSELVDQMEDGYLGDLLDGQKARYLDLAWAVHAQPNVLGGGGPRLTDSEGQPFTAAYIDTIGQPEADLRSDIAAEARAKIVYERLIKGCDDPGVRDTLTFLMTREVAHQKMFEAALASITDNFPPGKMPGDPGLAHLYVADSTPTNGGGMPGFELAQANTDWGFDCDNVEVLLDEGESSTGPRAATPPAPPPPPSGTPRRGSRSGNGRGRARGR